MMNYRIITGFAAVAFVISVLSAIAGGVAFGALALRTFLGTLLFAGLGAGVSWVFGRYLAAQGSRSQDASAQEISADRNDAQVGTGEEVDIFIPEENPHLEDAIGEEQEAFDQDEVEELEGVEDPDEPEELEAVEAAHSDEWEAEEEEQEREGDEAVEAGEPLEAFPEEEGGFAEIDSMPALEGLGEGDSLKQEEQDIPPAARAKPVDVMGTAHDPEEAAKAIKTWLKKDEKG